ncbi:hypothetical protein JMN32_24925 [Fulvivirga sp. 29W222]|uniref:Fungal lipase-type domain-containing protein n=1 Tax=Fulvivirga marina TaxID=2494733 RepID=A0A937G350_9BACT|nr:hypothetical protein [Fulvivirga marina]MBL6449578.1 hypothetical protein [Fulvivirga marina]
MKTELTNQLEQSSSINEKTLQAVLVQLAASSASTDLDDPTLPSTWKLLTTKSVFALPTGNIQFVLAYGNVGDEVIACLSIGVPWSDFIGNYTSGFLPDNKQSLPEDVAGKAPTDATILSIYVAAYPLLRSPLWEALSFLNNPGVQGKPLYITGIGLGGPLAQIAALDLRPGNKGPDQQDPPQLTQPPSYVFSTGNFASTAFQQYYNGKVQNAYNLRAGSQALHVDQFPDQPSTGAGFAPLGNETFLPASIPKPYYTPWEVRDSSFYLKAISGKSPTYPPSPTIIPNPPQGFSQSLAFNLGKFLALTYIQAQEPGNPTPQEMKKIIDYGDSKVIAAIFSTSNSLTVAFRGSITYEEFLMMDTNSATSRTPYNEIITSGANEVYYANSQAIGEQIKQVVQELIGDKKLYVIGHGFGGALANIMAADFTFNTKPAIPFDAIYTFGASYFAGINMANRFNESLGNISYQILRPDDQIATALKTLPFWNPVNNIVALLGSLDVPDDTSHALSAYLSLLDPSRVISSSQHATSTN